jgi:hypothetical protein
MSTEIVVDAADFKSMEVQVLIFNRTSNYGRKEGEVCSPREFLETGIVLDVPREACAQGHLIEVKLKVVRSAEPLDFVAQGRVTSVERDAEDDRLTIHVEFVNVPAKTWAQVREVYSSRQAQVLELLQQVRGY